MSRENISLNTAGAILEMLPREDPPSEAVASALERVGKNRQTDLSYNALEVVERHEKGIAGIARIAALNNVRASYKVDAIITQYYNSESSPDTRSEIINVVDAAESREKIYCLKILSDSGYLSIVRDSIVSLIEMKNADVLPYACKLLNTQEKEDPELKSAITILVHLPSSKPIMQEYLLDSLRNLFPEEVPKP